MRFSNARPARRRKAPRLRPATARPARSLRGFGAHLSFTKAADELSLTQSAISRQIKALEDHLGLALFRRLHRALRADRGGPDAVQRVADDVSRSSTIVASRCASRPENRTVVVTTTPGFAGIWLIPRLTRFTAARPEVDVRISAGNSFVNLERDGVDLAIRYRAVEKPPAAAGPLFGEVVLPVCSPRLLRDPARPLKTPDDLRHHTLLHMEPDAGGVLQSWAMWLRAMKLEGA